MSEPTKHDPVYEPVAASAEDQQRAAVSAAVYLMDQARGDQDLRIALAAICSRREVPDVASFAREYPDEAIEIAEDYKSAVEQTPPGMDRLR